MTDVEAELNQDSQARDEFFSKFQNYVLLATVLKLFHYIEIPRNNKQVWILWNDEANTVEKSMDQYKFNWTISYKIESEASIGAYGFVGSRVNKMTDTSFDKFVTKNFEERKDQSIWFVSNCLSNFRNIFVVKLAAYTDVSHCNLFY